MAHGHWISPPRIDNLDVGGLCTAPLPTPQLHQANP